MNQALAFGPEIEYTLIGWPNVKYLVARDLAVEFINRITSVPSGQPARPWPEADQWDERLQIIKGSDLAGTVARHPMRKLGGFYARPRPFLPGDFVTTDSGTGLVHMSPDHGEDDFLLCRANGLEPVFAVMADGRYRDDWEWLGAGDLDENGKERRRSVINKPFNSPEGPICSDLREAGALLSASDDYQHSYPHSWRSKAKVIYRCTPQWFVPMDKELGGGGTLRSRAMSEIERVRFIPEKGRRRIGSMVEGRPDWVLSRQRAWGVPITLFVKNGTGEYLQDPEVNARVIAAVREQGVDAWDESRKAEVLGPDHNPDDYEMVSDILDVWFDSGCTHAFVLESGRWPEMQWPADLYLEGSDQHRGWFQSSLLESCATRGRAPYDQVLTHGFTMASDGRKMSKSLGNTIDPLKVMEQYGADIIRLWALSVDLTEDHRIGDEILKGTGDQYRKLRNTFRYLLGALDGFVGDMGDVGEVPELEVYILALLADLDGKLRHAAENYDFNAYTRLLVDFCNEDLSAFYFDIRKDVLYCDGPDSVKRNAYRTVLDLLFHALVRYAAPVLVFTAEEVWSTRYPDGGSVHLLEWPQVPGVTADGAKWAKLRELREDVMEAIEPLRREKVIRSGLEADVTVPADAVPEGFTDEDLAELFITASVARRQGDAVSVSRTDENKCGRCWRPLASLKMAICAIVAKMSSRSWTARHESRPAPPPGRLRRRAADLCSRPVEQELRHQDARHRPYRRCDGTAADLRPAFHAQFRCLAGHVRGDQSRNALGPRGGYRADCTGGDHLDVARETPRRHPRAVADTRRGAGQHQGSLRSRLCVDFADLHFGEFRPFLIFNVADAAITIGVLIVLAGLFHARQG